MRNKKTRWVCLSFVALAPLAIAAESLSSAATSAGEVTIEQVDAMITSMKNFLWELPGLLPDSPDESGRRFEDDLAEYVLADETLARIDALRAKLADALIPGSDKIAPAALAPLQRIVEVETCKVVVIRLHWDEGGDTSYPVQALEDLMQRLPEVRRTAFTPELEAIRQSLRRNRSRLVADIAECQSSPDISTSSAAGRMATLGDRYLELQGRLAVAIDAAVEAGESKPLQQQRSTPCPAPAVPGPGDTKIRYHTRANAADYYPAHARNLELEGIARMGVVYDSGGCILKAYVLRTAGSQLLDEAAMRMVFDMQLVPALQDGKPAAGEVVIPVNFHLRSE